MPRAEGTLTLASVLTDGVPMPVTAKLSRRFYEQFGDEIAAELVEWFNSVDATYRGDLREVNELNFARFDAKLEQRVTELRADFERRLAALDAKLEQRVAELRAEFRGTLSHELGTLRAELIKWSFVFFATAALAVIGLR
jgi:hypothetical protein